MKKKDNKSFNTNSIFSCDFSCPGIGAKQTCNSLADFKISVTETYNTLAWYVSIAYYPC